MSATRYRDRPGIRHFVLGLLVAFCAQAALAAHAWQHDELDFTDHCATCVQLEQLDGPVVVGDSQLPAEPARGETGPAAEGALAITPLPAFAARAPPTH